MRMITTPTQLEAAGTVPKSIFEYVGRMSGKNSISVARMVSPKGWSEPGQTPEFEEISLVLSGSLLVETRDGVVTLRAGQACIASPGEWVRYSTPAEPAEYVAICTPAFQPEIVHRDGN